MNEKNGSKNGRSEVIHGAPTVRDATAAGAVPSVAERAQALRDAGEAVTQTFAALSWLATLSPEERKRVFKGHNGVEPFALALGELIARRPELAPAGLDGSELVGKVDFVGALYAVHGILSGALRAVDDSILATRAEMYQETMDIYTVNQRNARRDPNLKAQLAAFEAFLALGPRPKKTADAPEPAATT